MAIFEPVGHKNDLGKFVTSELASYKKALRDFRSQKWDRAEMDFISLNRTNPDRFLYQVYLDRIAYYRKEPPGDHWDGAFTHTTK